MKRICILLTAIIIASSAFAQELSNFMGTRQIVSPEITQDGVTFRISAPKAYDVRLSGSWMPGWGGSIPMARDTSGVWYATIETPSPEIYTYNFIVDGVSVGDANNVLMQRDGTRYLSMLLIDGERSQYYREATHRGTLTKVWYDSPTIGSNRRMFVYTPYGYEANKKMKYPVLYLLHGSGGDEDAWSTMGRTCQIMDNLIEAGKAVPMIVVMPNGNPWQDAAVTQMLPQRTMDRRSPSFQNLYVTSIVKDIVPFIEKNYRAIAKPESRAVAGLSMGGGHTMSVTNLFPGVFQYICPLSMGIRIPEGGDSAKVLDDYKKAFLGIKKAGYKLYWVACGDSDFLWESAQTLDKVLTETGLEHTFYVTDGGHTWANWRHYLCTFAPLLFK